MSRLSRFSNDQSGASALGAAAMLAVIGLGFVLLLGDAGLAQFRIWGAEALYRGSLTLGRWYGLEGVAGCIGLIWIAHTLAICWRGANRAWG